jgi:tetratricopeptide (TPR) repeat protein
LRKRLTAVLGLFLILSILPVAGWLLFRLGEATLRRLDLDLEMISVPQRGADDGLSSQVITQRLRDEINAAGYRAHISLVDIGTSPGDVPDVVIPTVGISVGSVVNLILFMLPQSLQHKVSGEFTGSGQRLFLTLRMNSQIIFSDSEAGGEAAEQLIRRGAFSVVEKTYPFVAAAAAPNITAALAAVDRIIDSYPPSDEIVRRAHILKGSIADKLGRTDDAIAEYQEAIRLHPKSACSHNSFGVFWYNHHRINNAIAEYKEAIRLDPNFAMPYYNLGVLWKAEGRTDDAIAKYRDAMFLDPKYALPHFALAIIWREQGETDEAIAEYREAIRLDPKSPLPHHDLGNIWREQGKTDDAIVEYREAINLDPNYALPHYGLGRIWQEQGKTGEAIAEYSEDIRLDPKNAVAHYNLGVLWKAQGSTDKAIAEYQSAILLEPKYALPHFALGIIRREQGNTDNAITEFREAIRLDPKYPGSYYNLGVALHLTASASTGPEKEKWLRDACEAFAKGESLIPKDPAFLARMQEVDVDLQSEGRCLPP